MKKINNKVPQFNKKQVAHHQQKKWEKMLIQFIVLSLFPSKEADKNEYYNSVLGYLTPTATKTRLHINATKFTTFSDLIGDPASPSETPPNTNGTPHTWNFVYPQVSNTLTYTRALKNEKRSLIVTIEAALRDLFSDIPDSAIIPEDTLALGIRAKSDRKKAEKDPPKITELVVIGLKSLGGGMVEVSCRTSSDTKKVSKLNPSVEIELAYSILDKGEAVPADSSKCEFKETVTKAKWQLELGETEVGKKLVLFARWVYTKHKGKSGNFGSAVSIVIS